MIGAKSRRAAAGSLRTAIHVDDRPLRAAWEDAGRPDVAAMIDKALARHAPIETYFFRDQALRFQRLDSKVALNVLHDLAGLGIPCAAFHDSFCVRVRNGDAAELERAMAQAYRAEFGFEPMIEGKT